MTLQIYLQPMLGLGFAFNFVGPFIEIAFGPFIIIFGDLSRVEGIGEDEGD